jgi:hypothetical protein
MKLSMNVLELVLLRAAFGQSDPNDAEERNYATKVEPLLGIAVEESPDYPVEVTPEGVVSTLMTLDTIADWRQRAVERTVTVEVLRIMTGLAKALRLNGSMLRNDRRALVDRLQQRLNVGEARDQLKTLPPEVLEEMRIQAKSEEEARVTPPRAE